MAIKTKLLFIIIGDDKTGKTTLQKLLIEKLCNEFYDRLPTNTDLNITHPEIKRKYKRISFGNRSYQEKKQEYGTVDEYFNNHFKDCEISFISTHLVLSDVEQMIVNGKRRFFNVNGVFFTNSIHHNIIMNSQISELNWDERFLVENSLTEEKKVYTQLNLIAESIVDLLINRTKIS